MNKDENLAKGTKVELGQATNVLGSTTIALAAWAGVVTLALAGMVVLVFRRIRRGGVTWSSKTDAESGRSSENSSEKSSVIDLNDAQSIAQMGLGNSGYEAEFDAESIVNHEEVDFDTVDGLYDDNASDMADVHAEGKQPPSFSRALTKSKNSNSQNLRGLFLPDSGSSF